MNTVTGIALGFCTAVIFIGAVYNLCPDKSMGKPVKFVFGIAFICITVGVVTAVGNKMGNYKFKYTENVSTKTAAAVNNQVEYICGAILSDMGITDSKIYADTDILKDGGIVINSVTVYCNGDKQAVEREIRAVIDTSVVEVVNE